MTVMRIAAAPLAVACRTCGAGRGTACRSKSRWSLNYFHAGRRQAIAHLSNAEKAEAYAEVEAEIAERRAQTMAVLAELTETRRSA